MMLSDTMRCHYRHSKPASAHTYNNTAARPRRRTRQHHLPVSAPAGATLSGPAPRANASSPPQSSPSLLALTQWALAAGVKYAPGIRPTETATGGRGVSTAFPVPAGAALISVPSALTLSSAAAAPAAVPPAVWAAAPWYARLAALLLHERAAGGVSRLGPFLAVLPSSADGIGLPVTWADEEVGQLQCPAVVRQVVCLGGLRVGGGLGWFGLAWLGLAWLVG